MPSVQRYKNQPVNRVAQRLQDSGQGNLVRRILTAMNRALLSLPEDLFGVGLGEGGSSISDLPTRTLYRWAANGPYKVDTEVDGAWIAPTALTIKAVYVHRTTAGTSSSTILDLNKNGTTMYSNQSNRPTIDYDDSDLKVQATLPNTTSVSAGDILTMDIDQIEGGKPADLALTIEGA
jgi:hypothetical protein